MFGGHFWSQQFCVVAWFWNRKIAQSLDFFLDVLLNCVDQESCVLANCIISCNRDLVIIGVGDAADADAYSPSNSDVCLTPSAVTSLAVTICCVPGFDWAWNVRECHCEFHACVMKKQSWHPSGREYCCPIRDCVRRIDIGSLRFQKTCGLFDLLICTLHR